MSDNIMQYVLQSNYNTFMIIIFNKNSNFFLFLRMILTLIVLKIAIKNKRLNNPKKLLNRIKIINKINFKPKIF
jgi:hypothetical protein